MFRFQIDNQFEVLAFVRKLKESRRKEVKAKSNYYCIDFEKDKLLETKPGEDGRFFWKIIASNEETCLSYSNSEFAEGDYMEITIA